jgi:hypothetical protein
MKTTCLRFSFLASTLLICGCQRMIADTQTLSEVIPVLTEETKQRLDICKSASALLFSSQFDKLEAMAQEFRVSKATYYDGNWKLTGFYRGVSEPANEEVETQWTQRLDRIRAWAKERPDSITARVALAETLSNYAWHARGPSWSKDVSKEGWLLMKERLSESWQVLVQSKYLPAKCPGWWAAAQRVALGQGWDRTRYERLFQEAIAFEPSYNLYYYRKAVYLQPRWFGEEGEFGRFMNSLANRIGGDEGDVLYARIMWELDSIRMDRYLVKSSMISWPRIKHGFEVLINRYPDSLSAKSQYGRLCRLAGDREQMRKLFDQIGARMDMRIWQDDKERFIEYRKWAYEK